MSPREWKWPSDMGREMLKKHCVVDPLHAITQRQPSSRFAHYKLLSSVFCNCSLGGEGLPVSLPTGFLHMVTLMPLLCLYTPSMLPHSTTLHARYYWKALVSFNLHNSCNPKFQRKQGKTKAMLKFIHRHLWLQTPRTNHHTYVTI